MDDADVLNGFKQAGPDGDNELFVDGTMDMSGDMNVSSVLSVDNLTVSGSAKINSETGQMLSSGGQVLGSRQFTVLMPDISDGSSVVTLFPGMAGILHEITLTMQGSTGVGDTVVSFVRFPPPAGATVAIATSSITVPGSSSTDYVNFSSPTLGGAVFSATDALRITTNGGSASGSKAVVSFQFLIA